MKSLVILLFSILPIYSQAALEACGAVSFDKTMSCNKAAVLFDLKGCGAPDGTRAADSVSCQGNELVAVLKTKAANYRAVLERNEAGEWQVKGHVWKFAVTQKAKKKIALNFNEDQGTAAGEPMPVPVPVPAESKVTTEDVSFPVIPTPVLVTKSESASPAPATTIAPAPAVAAGGCTSSPR
jgi:hypothetical protein